MAVEWVRSCYVGYWRFFVNNEAIVTRGRYYFVPPETPFLPVAHPFGSADWHYSRDELYEAPEVGEDRSLRVGWDDGVLRVPIPPAVAVGGNDCFLRGELYPVPSIDRTLPGGIDSRAYSNRGLPVPAYPQGGSVMWFRPEELAGYSGGAPLKKWVDVSTYRNDLLQATVGLQPLVQLAAINGLPGVRFSAAQGLVFGQDPTTAVVPIVFGPAMSVYVVAKAAGAGGVGGFALQGPDAIAPNQLAEALGGRPAAVGGSFSQGQTFTAAPGVAVNTAAVYSLRREPETVRYGANGTDVLVTAIDETATATVEGLKAWQFGIPAQRQVFVCEVLIYDWTTSPEEHDAIMTYLGAKYAIPVNV